MFNQEFDFLLQVDVLSLESFFEMLDLLEARSELLSLLPELLFVPLLALRVHRVPFAGHPARACAR